MALTAPTSKLFAASTAASAARFIAVTGSSTRFLLAGVLQPLGRLFETSRQLDAHLGVVEKPAAKPEQVHGRAGAASPSEIPAACTAFGSAEIAPSPATPTNAAVKFLSNVKDLP